MLSYKNSLVLLIATVVLFSTSVFSQTFYKNVNYSNPDYKEFEKLSLLLKGNNYKKAKVLVDNMLAKKKGYANLMLLRSVISLRQRDYRESQIDAKKVLYRNRFNKKALEILGYNYLWQGNYSKAKTIFNRMLQIYANNPKALRGKKHAEKWRTDIAGSLNRFVILKIDSPNGNEILADIEKSFAKTNLPKQRKRLVIKPSKKVALLTANPKPGIHAKNKPVYTAKKTNLKNTILPVEKKKVVEKKNSNAKPAYSENKPFDTNGAGSAPTLKNASARTGKSLTNLPIPIDADTEEPIKETAKEPTNSLQNGEYGYKPRIDFTILGGYTRANVEGVTGTTTKTGVRFVEVAVEPVKNTRFWFQFDNGLSLDNASLARTNERAPTYWFGGLVNYKRHYLTKFAYGRRNLPGDVSQNLFDIEQVFFLPKNYTYKIGAIIAPRSDDRTEFIFRTGVGVPIGEKLRLEPTVFYSQSGFEGERQIRGLLAADYKFDNGFQIGGGFATGRSFRPNPLSDDTVTDVFFRTSAPLWKYIRPQFIVRREDIGNTNTTVVSFGFTVSNKELR